MQVYEIGYLILPSIPEDGVNNVVEKIHAAISNGGGKIIDGESPFKQDLAYPMSKTVGASRYVVSDAYLGWTKFELDPSAALEVKSAMGKIDEVLRFIFIKAPRETSFTFAKARAAAVEKMAESAPEESNSPAPEAVVE